MKQIAAIIVSVLVLTITLFLSIQSYASSPFKIVYEVMKGERGVKHIFIMDSDGGNPKQLTQSPSLHTNPSWSPDGKVVFDTNKDGNWEIYTVFPDGSKLLNLTNTPNFHERAPVISPDGKKIAFSSGSGIYVIDIDGGNRRRLSNENIFAAQDFRPYWSPDGTRIAFTSFRDGNYEIYIMDVDGKNHINLTNNSSWDTSPCWSPDGQSILFASDRRSPMVNFEIFQLDIKSGKVKQLTDEPGWDRAPCWSPDGKKIAFESDRFGGQFDIYVMDIDGKNVVRLSQTPWHEMEPAWSPPSFQAINPTGKRIESWGIMKRGW